MDIQLRISIDYKGRPTKSRNRQSSKKIGIIYNPHIDNQDLNISINLLIRLMIRVKKSGYSFHFKNTKRTNQETKILRIIPSDITWYGVPKHNDITSFTDQDLDLLILCQILMRLILSTS